MPRNSEAENARVTAAVVDYLSRILATPGDAGRLSISSVSRALRISRVTLRKYRLDERIAEAEKKRRKETKSKSTIDRLEERIEEIRTERDEWKRCYDGLVERYTKIQDALRSRRDIDLDAIIAAALAPPNRQQPARTRSTGGRRRGRA